MYAPTLTATFLSLLLPLATAHIGLYHPAALDFNGDGYTVSEPLSNLPEREWWFHGPKALSTSAKALAAKPVDLPAGGSATVELACDKKYTSYGSETSANDDPCPGPSVQNINALHAGEGVFDPSEILGCGLAIAYKTRFEDVRKEDFTVFSVNHDCVHKRHTRFQVPKNMPACPGGKCICSWFWQGQNSRNEMYMTGFACSVSGATATKAVAKGRPPVYCKSNEQSCVRGAKQPMYWANSEGGNVANAQNMEYSEKPAYNDAWGFKNGAQNDIFGNTAAQVKPPTPAKPTTMVTSTRKNQSKPTPKSGNDCGWPGHCEGARCKKHGDCMDPWGCFNGKCAVDPNGY